VGIANMLFLARKLRRKGDPNYHREEKICLSDYLPVVFSQSRGTKKNEERPAFKPKKGRNPPLPSKREKNQ